MATFKLYSQSSEFAQLQKYEYLQCLQMALFFTRASRLSQPEMMASLYDVQTFSDVNIDLVISKGFKITSAMRKRFRE